ncbi:hypothetical protein [Thiomicrorhabdus sp.]|uniref:hypothetical protein n=1 Tax=Thiomicrorhabdus sp. TaxID=2039724 RepID=UPI0029C873EB|nr:hypothetical protein [Thiomicrorhabdus sp.]
MGRALTLWIPDFYPALQAVLAEKPLAAELHLPTLQGLWSKGDILPRKPQSFQARACHLFHQPETLPAAAVQAAVQLPDFDANAFWVKIDPVQMIPDRDTLVLIPPQDLAITEAESQALVEAFNLHFGDDGIQLEYGGAYQWYLRIRQKVDIGSVPLEVAAYRNLHGLYPSGNAATYWRQLMNETQMLFFDHPVNLQRRERGDPEINSVWVWGEGVLSECAIRLRPKTAISGSHDYLHGLAVVTQAEWQATPDNLASCRSFTNDGIGHEMVHIPLQTSLLGVQSLNDLEENWFLPLLNAIRQKKYDSVLIDLGAEKLIHVNPGHLRRFWRRKKRLDSIG